jgi:hypothetical protein
MPDNVSRLTRKCRSMFVDGRNNVIVIIERSGGEISAENRPTGSAVFRFSGRC